MKSLITFPILLASVAALLSSCSDTKKKTVTEAEVETIAEAAIEVKTKYPSDVIPFLDKWKILLGDGSKSKELVNFENEKFFYDHNDGKTDWIVYKTPNSGITSKTSSNTRTELHQKDYWKTEAGGKLTGTLKVMHVSTSGDPRVAASYSVVVGQIHSNDGHKNEPLKIKNSLVTLKDLCIGIMKLILKEKTQEDGIFLLQYGVTTCQWLRKVLLKFLKNQLMVLL